jgi:hypothetical protein
LAQQVVEQVKRHLQQQQQQQQRPHSSMTTMQSARAHWALACIFHSHHAAIAECCALC